MDFESTTKLEREKKKGKNNANRFFSLSRWKRRGMFRKEKGVKQDREREKKRRERKRERKKRNKRYKQKRKKRQSSFVYDYHSLN